MKLGLALAFLATTGAALASTHWGARRRLGDGYARTFTKVEHHRLKEIGIVISHHALETLSMNMEEHLLPLPEHTPNWTYKHVTLDWNPHGHEPDNVYTKPHFDFHFYFISNRLRQNITCMGSDAAVCTKTPGDNYVADHYAPTPAGVPKMGWHWVDLLAPEFNGGEFTRTFIYGYYNGKMSFAEPMVTLDYLKSKKTSVNKIRRPEAYPFPGHSFPGQYKVTYDPKSKLHKVVLRMLR